MLRTYAGKESQNRAHQENDDLWLHTYQELFFVDFCLSPNIVHIFWDLYKSYKNQQKIILALGSMSTKNKAITLEVEEKSGSSSSGRNFPEQPAKKKGKKTPGKKQYCIKNHRLVYSDSLGQKVTEAMECARVENFRHDEDEKHDFNVMFASVYHVTKILGGVGPVVALSIMPYLMHRGECQFWSGSLLTR